MNKTKYEKPEICIQSFESERIMDDIAGPSGVTFGITTKASGRRRVETRIDAFGFDDLG